MADFAKLQNIDAEKEVLNAIMSKPGNLYEVSRILKTDDFYRETHRLLYKAMAEMILSNEPVDMVTLAEKLRHEGNLDRVGLRTITDIGRNSLGINIQAQAKIIAEYARRRRLIEKARSLEAMAADFQQDVDQVAFGFANDIAGMTSVADDNTKTAKEGLMELSALIDKRMQRKDELLNTGLADLDAVLTGFEAGQLVVIAGRPGHGKTALAGTMAVNMAKRGRKILMFSMEMSREELLARFVSREGDVSGEKIKKPHEMTAEDWNKYFAAFEAVGKFPLMINSQANLTPAEVANIATRIKGQHGLDVVMIDYLQLMSSGRRTDSRVQEISYITRALKNLAVSLKVPIILLSQLNRSNDREKRQPQLTDLRDSGSIEQDANTVILINRDSETGEGETVKLTNKTFVNVAKQRDGACGAVVLAFIPNRGFFADYIDVPV